MNETASEAIDELFTKIRLNLLKLRESDPVITDELKNQLVQLEDWVQKLVIDSLKLESIEKSSKEASKKKD